MQAKNLKIKKQLYFDLNFLDIIFQKYTKQV